MLFCSNSDITVKSNLNGFEIVCSLILKLSHLNIIHQLLVVFIAVPVSLRAVLTVFLSSVCTVYINKLAVRTDNYIEKDNISIHSFLAY